MFRLMGAADANVRNNVMIKAVHANVTNLCISMVLVLVCTATQFEFLLDNKSGDKRRHTRCAHHQERRYA